MSPVFGGCGTSRTAVNHETSGAAVECGTNGMPAKLPNEPHGRWTAKRAQWPAECGASLVARGVGIPPHGGKLQNAPRDCEEKA